MTTIKTGMYKVSIFNKTLIYQDSDRIKDVSHMVASFDPFKKIRINPEYDTVYLTKTRIGYVFSALPILTDSLLESHILADSVIYADVKYEDLIKEESKMVEKERYDVFDGAIAIATRLELDVALCLIDGYVKKYKDEFTGISLIPSVKNK